MFQGANAEIARICLIGRSGATVNDRFFFPAAKDHRPKKNDRRDREAAPGNSREATAASRVGEWSTMETDETCGRL